MRIYVTDPSKTAPRLLPCRPAVPALVSSRARETGEGLRPVPWDERQERQGRKLARYSVGVLPVSSRNAALNADSEV